MERSQRCISLFSQGARKSAFSLIELLVTTSLIVLLIALLLPALQRARESSRQVMCLNNLHGQSVAFSVYAVDEEDRLPTGMAFNNTFSKLFALTGVDPWVYVLGRDQQIYGAGVCPSDAERACFSKLNSLAPGGYDSWFLKRFGVVPTDQQQAAQMWPWSYATNAYLNQPAHGGNGAGKTRFADIMEPRNTYMITDYGKSDATYSSWYIHGFGYVPPRWIGGIRHLDGRNIALADGHSEYTLEPAAAPVPDSIAAAYLTLGYRQWP